MRTAAKQQYFKLVCCKFVLIPAASKRTGEANEPLKPWPCLPALAKRLGLSRRIFGLVVLVGMLRQLVG
jgi:hypothetical protein